jgi:pimeloyl-ACP methyl ester carboxylesterase
VTLTTIRRDVEGRRVLERIGGRNDAPPLVLVHGLGVRGRYLMPVAERLASDYRVAIPDLPDVPVDVPGRRAALSDWMRAAGIARAPLLANSLGCQIAVDLAVTAPAARSLLRQALRLVATAAHERPALDALVVAEYASHPLATLRAARAMLADRIEEKLPSVEAPVLVVRGEHDRIVPQAWAEEVARLARGRLEVLPGGHALNFTSPEELARVVRSFLR